MVTLNYEENITYYHDEYQYNDIIELDVKSYNNITLDCNLLL